MKTRLIAPPHRTGYHAIAMRRDIILIGATADPVSGWGMIAYRYAEALHAAGIPFKLLVPRGSAVPSASFSSSILPVLPDLPLTFGTFFSAARLPRLWNLSHAVRAAGPAPSVVHSLVDFPYALIGRRIASRCGAPFVMSAIATYSVAPFRRFPDKFLFRDAVSHADRVIAISAYTAREFRFVSGFPGAIPVMYLPAARPVPAGHEDFSIWRRIPSGRLYVLTVATVRIAGRKGFDVLYDAFCQARVSFPRAHLIVVGADIGRTDAYTSFDRVSPAELAALYSRSCLFAALPRRSGDYFEGYGLVYGEAGLYGLPVVGSASGGIPEAVLHGVTGILVPEEDAAGAGRAICRLLRDPAYAGRLGFEGRVRAEARTWGDYAGDCRAIYDSLPGR